MEFLYVKNFIVLLLLLFINEKSLILSKTVFYDNEFEYGAANLTINNHIDEWAIHLDGDLNYAHQFAKLHDLVVINKIGSLDGYYRFKLKHERKKRMINNEDYISFEEQLKSHKLVKWYERQKKLVRNKRDFINNNNNNNNNKRRDTNEHGIDPLWSQMWYLNRQLTENLPDMNVMNAWAMGYSGKGVSVTFLDDGLERDHPDLIDNYDPLASYDANSNDDDPMPRYDPTNENKHGTRCAGEVAALANNSICSVGVAFNAGVGGIRMLDGDVTDSVEATSLSYNRHHVDIYSASWGPDDNGEVVDGPGVLARKALVDGVQQGRKGKGSIFVWASGNGGRFGDACSCDGYVNSIFTLAISSTSESNDKPWYLEECPATLATTYSSGDERGGDRDIATTDIRHECTTRHTGTSAAAPLAAGIIALGLEANPNLTWRDVMFIVVLSSRPKAIKSNNYIANKRGFLVSSRYGFGLMDAGKLVELSKNWKNVPPMASCSTKDLGKPNTIIHNGKIESILYTDGCENSLNEINYIEQVEIVVSISAPSRGALEINITSPSGTTSQLLPKRNRDTSSDGFKNWSFMSVQTWGENPSGTWKLEIFPKDGTSAQLESFYLNIHGTKDEPVNYKSVMNSESTYNCHVECVADKIPCGPTEYNCTACVHFTLTTDDGNRKCVPHCPRGYYTNNVDKKCEKCDISCLECYGPGSTDCTNCDNKLLKLDTHECVSNCPSEGYFQNSNYDCELCDPFCLECKFESTYCTKCKDNITEAYNTTKLIQVGSFCITEDDQACGSGYYFDKNEKTCKFCDITCIECNGPTAMHCTKCPVNRPNLKNQQCVTSCDDGFYFNETLSYCFPCNKNCKTCQNGSNDCLSCKEGFIHNYNGQGNTCSMIILYDENCHESCYECYGSKKNQCRLCKNDLILHDGECLSFPPIGYYKSIAHNSQGTEIGVFEKCDLTCKGCANLTTCTSCHDGDRLVNGKCYQPCSENEFINVNGTCTACKTPCSKCNNENMCLTCIANKYILENKCYDTCPLNYYNSLLKCERCHPSCETCSGPGIKECLTCNEGFKFNGMVCASNCLEGTYYDNSLNECFLCNSTLCEQCIENPNKCTKCTPPLVLDSSTYTCKKCCTRSVYGKIKDDFTFSCCNCPSSNAYTGYCLDELNSNLNRSSSYNPLVILKNIYEEYNSTSIIMFSILLIFISFGIIIWALVIFKRSCSKTEINVEYSPLNQLLNDGDDDYFNRQQYNNNSLNDEEDDYELNASDYRSFNGKIKQTKIDSDLNDNSLETNKLLIDDSKA